MKPRLCIDIDNVIAETDEVIREIISALTDGRVNLQYQDVVEFDYQKCRDANGEQLSNDEWRKVHTLFSEDKNIRRIRPLGRVQSHLTSLSDRFSLHFATARLRSARLPTLQWLDVHGFPDHDLHFITHGEKHASLGGFHAAVEDNYDQAISFAEMGVPCYLIKHPWNAKKPPAENVGWVSSWPELVSRLSNG